MNDNKTEAGDSPVPTPYELARLAAALYAVELGSGRHGYTQDHALKDGLALWLNASELLENWRTDPACVFPPQVTPTPPPEPKSYPVKLDKFLSLMLPRLSGRSGDKADIFRQFLEYRLRNPSMPPSLLTWDHIPRDVYQKWNNHFPLGVMYLESNFQSEKPIPFDCCNPKISTAVENRDFYSCEMPPPRKIGNDDVDRHFAFWNSYGIPDRNSFLYHRKSFQDSYDMTHPAELHTTKAESAFIGHAQRRLRKHLFKRFCEANPTTKVALKEFPVSPEQMIQLRDLNKSKSWKDYKTWNYEIAANS